jgi:hypothetical protein
MAEWKKVVVKGDNITNEELVASLETTFESTDGIIFSDFTDDGKLKRTGVVNLSNLLAGATSAVTGITNSGATLAVDINGLSEWDGASAANDYVLIWDASVSQFRKASASAIGSAGTDTNTTYTIIASNVTTNEVAKITLNGSDASTDDVAFHAGNGLTLSASAGAITFGVAGGNGIIVGASAISVTLQSGGGLGFSSGALYVASAPSAAAVNVANVNADAEHYLVFTDAAGTGTTLGLDSDTLRYNPGTQTLTVSNLTVSGTTTTVNTDNLLVTDKFIGLANGSSGNVDSGFVFKDSDDYVSFGWDTSAGRFGMDASGAVYNQETIDSDAFVVAFHSAAGGPATAASASYAKGGNIYVDTVTEDIYIYVA